MRSLPDPEISLREASDFNFASKLCRDALRERAQSFVTDGHFQLVVRPYQDFKDEPGFTRVMPIEEIRAKDGNLSIPLYVGGETQAQPDTTIETAMTALPGALAAWPRSSIKVHAALEGMLLDK